MPPPCPTPPDEDVLARVRAIALDCLGARVGRIWLFGSWATGRRHRASDIDLALDFPEPIPRALTARLREAFEESTIPYPVEVVDLAESDPEFRERVRREGVPWSVSKSA